jgi:hypothetical protein
MMSHYKGGGGWPAAVDRWHVGPHWRLLHHSLTNQWWHSQWCLGGSAVAQLQTTQRQQQGPL